MSMQKTDDNRVKIFDTTLRDGEQSPGFSMNHEEKLRMASMLEELGVDIIEAGFPIASQGDFESVRAIAKQASESVVIAGLCRASTKDIERAWEALQYAPKARIHTFISTSPVHMKYKLRMEPEAVLEAIHNSVSHAASLTSDVEWSPEDGTRTEPDFLVKSITTAVKAGATTINVPDTVGYLVADEYAELIQMLLKSVPGLDKCTISTHCHNDLGVAVANSLGGVSAGARQIECTINGIGERAGNASLEEVAMALQVRGDRLPYWTNIDSTKLLRASQMLQSITGFSVQPNKAIVGANAFAHESGIHQDGMLKNAQTYEIMTPESVGWTKTNLVLGKHSGRAAFRDKLVQLGYEDIGENAFQDAFVRFKDLADHKKEVTDEDIVALVDDSASDQAASFVLDDLKIHSIVHGVARVDVTVSVEGEAQTVTTEGNGAVDAIFKGIKDVTGLEDQKLDLYQVHAVTGGTDAQAKVTVRLSQDGRTVSGTGADYDTLFASARAYIHALNKLQVSEKRVHAHRGGEDEAA